MIVTEASLGFCLLLQCMLLLRCVRLTRRRCSEPNWLCTALVPRQDTVIALGNFNSVVGTEREV